MGSSVVRGDQWSLVDWHEVHPFLKDFWDWTILGAPGVLDGDKNLQTGAVRQGKRFPTSTKITWSERLDTCQCPVRLPFVRLFFMQLVFVRLLFGRLLFVRLHFMHPFLCAPSQRDDSRFISHLKHFLTLLLLSCICFCPGRLAHTNPCCPDRQPCCL